MKEVLKVGKSSRRIEKLEIGLFGPTWNSGMSKHFCGSKKKKNRKKHECIETALIKWHEQPKARVRLCSNKSVRPTS